LEGEREGEEEEREREEMIWPLEIAVEIGSSQ